MYTKKDFGRDVLIELSHGYDPIRIARWADHLFNSRIQEDVDEEVDNHIKDLSCMSFGEEFIFQKMIYIHWLYLFFANSRGEL
jgi:hypothetical protein